MLAGRHFTLKSNAEFWCGCFFLEAPYVIRLVLCFRFDTRYCAQGPGWVFNNLIHPGIRYSRYRAHKDIKPIATHALTQSKLAAQFVLLSSTVPGLGVKQLRSIETALAANMAALDAELARRASGGAVSGAELLAEGPVTPHYAALQNVAAGGSEDTQAPPRTPREAMSPRASGRWASDAQPRNGPEAAGRPPAEAYAGAAGGGALAWITDTGSAIAEAMGVGGGREHTGDADSKKDS